VWVVKEEKLNRVGVYLRSSDVTTCKETHTYELGRKKVGNGTLYIC
jgi:hypothetical protein